MYFEFHCLINLNFSDVDESHMLNVSREDSPYALINAFFPDREVNHRLANQRVNIFAKRFFLTT